MTNLWIAAVLSLVWFLFMVTVIPRVQKTRTLRWGMNLVLVGQTGFSATVLWSASNQLGYTLGGFALLISLSTVAYWWALGSKSVPVR